MKHPAFAADRLPAIGGWIVTENDRALDAYTDARFDYVGIDCQHSVRDESSAALLIRRSLSPTRAILARAGSRDDHDIGKLLDAGADGVIVPGVDTAEQARRVVAATQYPPVGVRSYGPLRADLGKNPAEIAAHAGIFVMIESALALENRAEIASTAGLSGIYLGPADLAISLGFTPAQAFSTDCLEPAFRAVAEACAENGILLGAHASDPECARRWAAISLPSAAMPDSWNPRPGRCEIPSLVPRLPRPSRDPRAPTRNTVRQRRSNPNRLEPHEGHH